MAALVAALIVGVGLGWAARVLLAPPAPLPSGPAFVVMAATDGSVGRTIDLNAEARWTGGGLVANVATGTVTKVRVTGSGEVQAGDAVYDVDLEPVWVAQGSVPAFRTLGQGARGDDVRQLQALLKSLGLMDTAPDGRFGPGTARGVERWQREHGERPTGEVPLGRLLFVPELPAKVALQGFHVGSVVSPGSSPAAPDDATVTLEGVGIKVLPAAPTFTITLPESQAALVRTGMSVQISKSEYTWDAEITEIGDFGTDGAAIARLGPTKGSSSICERDCSSIPPGGEAALAARIELIPMTAGVVVPTTALVVGTDGSAAVLAEDGTRMPVTVVASSGGRAVVEGVAVGQKIRIADDAQP
ncbi:peptidoglycan-binding domain-containing protein [Phycicoccus endophyticus]|uniref:peptidoglycan-binding domain-containing protein n=1 Tax=Phycicoccus endophyticus TaxID=1690220 RepID=UPI00140BED6B|nr:peptidoglycan-binding domain-containing protein [Phycicoccus endophyticus]NHI19445.1 peptidoglycan-binding protein [Phycicoccus endophyticus]